ncbi:MAG: OmpH family outer membrane protein [Bacteroidales bacterium]|nr:OmpH family outer membrane protein [Bacteroidales bacterium]MBD5281654.1 OmpH family outer membrane protein [Bacteroides sp.]MDE6033564.1 OmpH family outer membrane protein [Muribaculaceae bacterium]MBD5293515.1 OmpH family outer membrane protein [Bacteroides sp.]MBD5352463.1 OmpH family outer membrane protein [Bacteroides sp.]
MIKKILVALAIALPSMAFAQKFAVVDTETIMTAMPETKAAEEKIQQSSKTYQDEFDKLNEEINKKYAEYQALPEDTPNSIKERRQQEIQELAEKVQRFQQQAQQDLERQHMQLLQPIQEKLLNAIKSVGAEGQYTMVFPNGMSLYTGTDVIDITDAVKAKLGI